MANRQWRRENDNVRCDPAAGHMAEWLVVLLHGVGAMADDLAGLADEWAPQLPSVAFVALAGQQPYDYGGPGRQWFSIGDISAINRQGRLDQAAPLLKARLEHELSRHGLPASRLILVGFSQGSMMALHLASADPALCALVVAYSGLLTSTPLSGMTPAILLIHGDADPVVPVSGSQQAAVAFAAAGRPTALHCLPGVPHTITEQGMALGLSAIQHAIVTAATKD